VLTDVVSCIGPATAQPSLVKSGYAQVGALRMYYEVHGEGQPLLVLHGGGSTIQTTYGAILPELARMRKVIAPEQQAHGHTLRMSRHSSISRRWRARSPTFDWSCFQAATARTACSLTSREDPRRGTGSADDLERRHEHLTRALVLGYGR